MELRIFGGLTIEKTAGVTGLSTATVKRDWSIVCLWLKRELSQRLLALVNPEY